MEGHVVGAGVETQGFPFFMELSGDARTAGQWHFEEVLKDVTEMKERFKKVQKSPCQECGE